jgi:proton-coupled amino acid transporter
MENKIEHPIDMDRPFGVVWTGMSLVTLIYGGCGFFGYITYGDNTQGSITLNLPQTT